MAACVRAAYTHYIERIGQRPGPLLDDYDQVVRDHHAYGRGLLEHAESEARRLGHGHLDLYTHRRMTENIAMYRRYGYEEVDRRTERGLARVYMRKRL